MSHRIAAQSNQPKSFCSLQLLNWPGYQEISRVKWLCLILKTAILTAKLNLNGLFYFSFGKARIHVSKKLHLLPVSTTLTQTRRAEKNRNFLSVPRKHDVKRLRKEKNPRTWKAAESKIRARVVSRSKSFHNKRRQRKGLARQFIMLYRLAAHSSAQMFLRTNCAACVKLTNKVSIPSFLCYFSAYSADPLSLD